MAHNKATLQAAFKLIANGVSQTPSYDDKTLAVAKELVKNRIAKSEEKVPAKE